MAQDKVLATIDELRPRGLGGRAYWLSGQTGTGKTTIAKLLAADVADDFNTDELSAGTLTEARLLEIERCYRTLGLGAKPGRAVIINEAHRLREDAIGALLDILERIPAHVAIIFTTTVEGQKMIFEKSDDTAPLLSRCVCLPLARRDLAKAFATRAQAIARAEGLDGRPIEDYVKLAQACGNSMREMLQRIENGAMRAGS